ncbi:hypothetical protein [Geoalkalibacter halelectricus]|uniref:hypothetical protein n=1 Tax=Geoalkalibacter halelectricus TaxID=2847045 RepID=UPI00266F7CE9|nr:hypothetical protein [Geoalkalibacter halelectricus]MDO3380429.1 hypothetical protein [Geoalkalibacter halelectricus]
MTAELFNERYPVGTRVRFYPTKGQDDFIETRTRSKAWPLAGGHPVVKLDGRRAGVSVKMLEVVG